MIFSVITKNLSWEILTNNLVPFKRWDQAKDKKMLTVFKIFSTPSAVMEKVKLKLVLTICSTVPTTRKNDWLSWTL